MRFTMLGMCMKSVRRMTKTLGGCAKLWLISLSCVFTLYTVWNMFIEKESMNTARWVTTDRSSPAFNNSLNAVCEMSCNPGEHSFYVRSGDGLKTGPIICYQGQMYMSDDLKNVGRGLNIVVIDRIKREAKVVGVYDTYTSDVPLLKLLKKTVTNDDIMIMASYDDVSTNLKESSRIWLTKYGSKLVKKVGFRENFIMIGMRGLESGKAIEYHQVKEKKKDFGPVLEKAGCFALPLGNIAMLNNTIARIYQGSDLMTGPPSKNCGLPQSCAANEVPVSISSGVGDKAAPTVCVDGFVRLAKGVNDGGRGVNVITLNHQTLQVMSTTHVDSYETDSTDVDFFLESLPKGTIVIVVIADEASRKLELSTREMFNQMGSGHIQNLRFRDLWYMVTQIGLKGFTKYEEIKYAPFSRDWPAPLDVKMCLPQTVPSSSIMPESGVYRNDKRRDFCTRHEGYVDFCNSAYVDDELKTIGVYTKDLKTHNVFETPIIIVPGINHNAFVATLQTTLLQPGVKPDLVVVFWDEKMPEYRELTRMFGFREYSLKGSTSYSDQLMKAMTKAKEIYPNATHFIVVEEDLLLAPDFLPFMAASMDVMEKDASIVGASAWNFNGFENMSGNAQDFYRTKDLPGLGFILKTPVMMELLANKDYCCSERAWFGWRANLTGREILMPALSRVYRMPFMGAMGGSDVARELFLRPRQTHLEPHPVKVDIEKLQAKAYEDFLQQQVTRASPIPNDLFDKCLEATSVSPVEIPASNSSSVVFYQQNNPSDFKLLRKLCRCFGLVTLNRMPPKNIHNGLLWFKYNSHDVFLVGTSSPYFVRSWHYKVLMDPEYFVKTASQH